jgi:hypothetical protein
MSKLRSFKRHLNPQKVWLANQVAEEKIKIARQVVLERAKKDAAFAADVLKAVGDALPKEIKEACEASVAAPKVTTIMVDESGLDQVTMSEKVAQIEQEVVLIEPKTTCCGGCGCGDLTHKMVLVPTDGGDDILVPETELPDYPRDGDEPPLDITEKLVQKEEPKANKA